MMIPNIDASYYPNEPQLKRVSPSARKQMHMGPEIEPFPEFFRRRLLATIRDDHELRAALAEIVGSCR